MVIDIDDNDDNEQLLNMSTSDFSINGTVVSNLSEVIYLNQSKWSMMEEK